MKNIGIEEFIFILSECNMKKKYVFRWISCFLLNCIICFLCQSCASTQFSDVQDLFSVDTGKYKGDFDASLFYAVKNNDLASVREYLSHNANPNVSDRLGQSALMWACWNGNKSIVIDLLEYKSSCFKKSKHNIPLSADCNAESNFSYTALMCAAHTGNVEIFDFLLSKKAHTNNIDKNAESLLHKAVKSGSVNMMKRIISLVSNSSSGINLDGQNRNGLTALHYAVLLKQTEFVTLLLESGANPNIPSDDSLYPLFSSINNRTYLIFSELLQNENTNCDVRYENLSLEEYLQKSVSMQSYKGGLEHFTSALERKRKGIPIDDGTYKKQLDFFYSAIEKKSLSLDELKPMCDKYLSEIMTIESGRTPLIAIAVNNCNSKLLGYLMEQGIGLPPSSGDILIYACKRWSDNRNTTECINLLIDNWFSFPQLAVTNTDINGKTGLMYILDNDELQNAISWKRVKKLLDIARNESMLNQCDENGNNLVYYALKSNSPERNQLFDYLFYHSILSNPEKRVNGKTSFLEFSYRNRFFYATKKLLDCDKIDCEYTNEIGKTIEDILREDLENPQKQKIRSPQETIEIEEMLNICVRRKTQFDITLFSPRWNGVW